MNAIEMLAATAYLARAAVDNIPSPCVLVCRMDAQRNFCEGCLRSIDEITLWSRASDQQKKAVWAQIEQRIAAIQSPAP